MESARICWLMKGGDCFELSLRAAIPTGTSFRIRGATRCKEISFYSKPLGIKNLLIVFDVTGSLFVWNETVASESAGEAILSSIGPTSEKQMNTQFRMTTVQLGDVFVFGWDDFLTFSTQLSISNCVSMAGNTNIVLHSSRLNQRIL